MTEQKEIPIKRYPGLIPENMLPPGIMNLSPEEKFKKYAKVGQDIEIITNWPKKQPIWAEIAKVNEKRKRVDARLTSVRASPYARTEMNNLTPEEWFPLASDEEELEENDL